MKQVANKRIIRTLSFRTMKEKGWKNLIAVLAIGLTALMFTAMFTVGMSMVDSMQEATMRQVGTRAHGGYKYMTEAEYEQLKAAGGYQDISYDVILGSGANYELRMIQTEVRFAEDKMAKWAFSYPETGRMPEAVDECAASSRVLEALGVPLEIGAQVPIQIKTADEQGQDKLISETFTLCGFWQSNDASSAEQFYLSEKWMNENIHRMEENYNEKMVQENDSSFLGSVQVNVMLHSAFDIERQIQKLTERSGLGAESVNESVNWAYAAGTMDSMTVLLGIIMLGIIMLSGYLIIYNIFYINVTADIRYYGLLKTIGTTGKQLRKMVRGQAFFLSVLGIPLGLAGGWLVGRGVLPVLYRALDTDGIQNISLNPWIFAFAAIFSLLVVYISCIKPCRLATSISPVEAVRFVENTQYKKKTKKTGKVTSLRMAAANMGRNKKKAVAVIASLTLSLILINTTYSLIKSFSFEKYVSSFLVSDFMLIHYSLANMMAEDLNYEAITPEVKADVEAIDGVEAVHTFPVRTEEIIASETIRERFRAYFESDEVDSFQLTHGKEEAEKLIQSGTTYGNVYGLGADALEYLTVLEGDIDAEKFLQGGYAIVTASEDEKRWIQTGDTITVTANEGVTKELQVMAVANMPYGIETRRHFGVFCIETVISPKDFDDLFEYKGCLNASIDVAEGKEKSVKKALETYIMVNQPDLVLTSKETLEQEFSQQISMFFVVGGLLGFILALIGILNLINATITSILSRKREFAMMQAVGMTGIQLEKMLIMESLLYGAGTLLCSLTFGNLVSYGFIYMIGKNMAYFVWNFTIAPILFSIPVIAAISVILPVVCYHVLCKKSIIERLRLAEV